MITPKSLTNDRPGLDRGDEIAQCARPYPPREPRTVALSLLEDGPRSAGTPCPDEERPQQAGLLAHGSVPVRAAFSGSCRSQWHVADGSPLTVAGAAGDCHPVPFESPFGEPVADAPLPALVQAIKWKKLPVTVPRRCPAGGNDRPSAVVTSAKASPSEAVTVA